MLVVDPNQECVSCEPIPWVNLGIDRAAAWLDTYDTCHHLGNCRWCIAEIEATKKATFITLKQLQDEHNKN